VVFADVDIADLSPPTLKFLEQVGTIFQSASLSEAFQRYVTVASSFEEEEIANVMKEIVEKRNAKVIADFDRYAPRFQTIYMPWGALHMPDLEDQLKARGYRIESHRMLQIARYETVLDALSGKAPPAALTAPQQPAAR
jgi:hypothetical protein